MRALTKTAFALLAMGQITSAHATAIADVSAGERAGYSEIYQLNIAVNSDYNGVAPAYSLNNSGTSFSQGISRVAYYLELGTASTRTWVWVSMNAFTQNLALIGVPYSNSAFFQQTLSNLHVQSNSANVTTGTIATGNIEFWNNCYGTSAGNSSIAPGNTTKYDFNDAPTTQQCYGSMQVHNTNAAQTIFAYNAWDHSGAVADDIGIGNQVGGSGHADWTYANNTASYTLRSLEVWVLATDANTNVAPAPATAALLAIGGLALRRRRR